MSDFKHGVHHGHRRPGEDPQIKQRRNLDALLIGNIPDNEWRRANNGQVVCLVCRDLPRFANLASLTTHRASSRHRGSEKTRAEKEKIQTNLARTRANRTASHSAAELHAEGVKTDARSPGLMNAPAPGLAAPAVSQPSSSSSQLIYDPKSGYYWDENRRCWSLLPPGTVDAKELENAQKRLCEMPHVRLAASSRSPPPPLAPKFEPLPPPEPSAEQRAAMQMAEYEMRMRERGWRKTPDGKWFKDENVEFDSDEDAPPPPPPPTSLLSLLPSTPLNPPPFSPSNPSSK